MFNSMLFALKGHVMIAQGNALGYHNTPLRGKNTRKNFCPGAVVH